MPAREAARVGGRVRRVSRNRLAESRRAGAGADLTGRQVASRFMALDPVAATMIQAMEGSFPRVETFACAADARRAIAAARPTAEVEPPPVARVENRTIPGPAGDIPVRVYWPRTAEATTAPGVVFFHGGGWVICDLDTHDGQCRALANGADAVVVSVDYRLAPEAKFPAAADDCYAATQWVADHAAELGIDPARLAIAGDSAGGNLTAADRADGA